MKMRINIEIIDNEGQVEIHPILVETELPEDGAKIIDDVEKKMLDLNKKAVLLAIETYMEELSKKKPEMNKQIKEERSKRIQPSSESMEK